jgi:hypothetical protein
MQATDLLSRVSQRSSTSRPHPRFFVRASLLSSSQLAPWGRSEICRSEANICSIPTDHVNFTTNSIPARSAPVTEFASFNIPASASSSEKSKLEDDVLKVTQFVDANNGRGTTVGWAIEEIDAPKGKVNPLQLLVGWDAVEDHTKAREHKDFPGLVAPIRAVCAPPKEGVQGMAMFHAKLTEAKP